MTSRPILFSGEMVRAILAGRKTQTRRVLKPMAGQQSKWLTAELLNGVPLVRMTETSTKGGQRDPGVQLTHPRGGPLGWIRSPYGGPGDQLWVKETHRHPSKENPRVRVEYRADMSSWGIADSYNVATNEVTADAKLFPGRANEGSQQHWRPSIFMPRWASRITLEITDVRVERLNAIGEEDAKAEGCAGWYAPCHPDQGSTDGRTPAMEYRELWESINGAGSWTLNPWCWVISFQRVSPHP